MIALQARFGREAREAREARDLVVKCASRSKVKVKGQKSGVNGQMFVDCSNRLGPSNGQCEKKIRKTFRPKFIFQYLRGRPAKMEGVSPILSDTFSVQL